MLVVKNKPEAAEKKSEKDGPFGLILYTDGSARPTNPGPAGWGMHGYLFSAQPPKKGSGNPDHVLTNYGYVFKSEYLQYNREKRPITEAEWVRIVKGEVGRDLLFEVTPIQYVDGTGNLPKYESNNLAELQALIRGLEYALTCQVEYVRIHMDAKYVQEGMTQWMPKWKAAGWRKGDGGDIANLSYWRRLDELVEQCKARSIALYFSWIKGHDDHLGNEAADYLSKIGSARAREAIREAKHSQPAAVSEEIDTTVAEGYWKYEPKKHPFINHRWMYFNTDLQHSTPGVYYLGEHGKDDELIGKRIPEGAHAVIYLKEPDPILELVRNIQSKLTRDFDTIASALLPEIYRPNTHQLLNRYGQFAIGQNKHNPLILETHTKNLITREYNPAKLAHRTAEEITDLDMILKKYQANDPLIVTTDLTPILYEYEIVQKKTGEVKTMKLKADYTVGFASLKVAANYLRAPGEIAQADVILLLGFDLLDRNALKRLESLEPKVTLVTWRVAERAFKYATIIEAQEDVGIWAGSYSNTRILDDAAQ